MAWPDNTTLIDDFNRASLGANWTTGSWYGDSALSIINSTLLGGASSWPGGYYNAASYGPDCNAIIDVPTANTTAICLCMRLDASNTPDGYKFEAANTASKIFRIDNSANTQLGAAFTVSLANGDKLGFEAIGSNLTAYKYTSGAWGSAIATRSDATYSGAGYFGVEWETATSRMDNLSGGTVASGAYTLAADHVHFTETGRAANLLFGRLLDAAHTHYTHTGKAANLLFGRHLDAAHTHFTHTGQAATLLWKRVLVAAHVHFALTGIDANLVRVGSYLMEAAHVHFTHTGQAAGLLWNRLVTAAHTHFTFTPNDAGLFFGRRLAADHSHFTLTGLNATLSTNAQKVLAAARALFTATGYAANLLWSGAKKGGDDSFWMMIHHRRHH